MTKVKLQPTNKIGMSAINSAGSGENVKLLRDNGAQFAILQGLFGYYAWNGKGPLEQEGPQKELRSVTMLWQNVEQFVVLADKSKTGSVADLALTLREMTLSPDAAMFALLSAHMIIFWLSQDSNVTPPLCLAVFTCALQGHMDNPVSIIGRLLLLVLAFLLLKPSFIGIQEAAALAALVILLIFNMKKSPR